MADQENEHNCSYGLEYLEICFPQGFVLYLGFLNKVINKKVKLKMIHSAKHKNPIYSGQDEY